MRWAGLDIGTNSVKLLVGEVTFDGSTPRLTEVRHDVRVTRMGEGLNATGELSPEGMLRALEAIGALVERARQDAPDGISALGMEAFRRASNGPAFARRVEEQLGVAVRILSGEEEARLGREGVLLGYGAPLPPSVLVIDVGGGSSEMALTSPVWQVSVPRGAVTTSEAFLCSDPPAADEMAAMRAELASAFSAAWRTCPACDDIPAVVAVGGTVTTYAAISLCMPLWDASRVHRLQMSRERLRAITDQLASLPLAARREVPGLHPDRAPYIIGGGALIEAILDAVGADALHVSVANLLHAHVVAEAQRARAQARGT